MLTPLNRRVQAGLQSHRKWLNTFTRRLHLRRPTQQFCLIPLRLGLEASPRHTTHVRHASSSNASVVKKFQYAQAHKPSKKFRRRLEEVKKQEDEAVASLSDLRSALEDGQIKDVVDLYAALPSKKWLSALDFRDLTSCLHKSIIAYNHLRPEKRKREDMEQFVAFAEQLVKDLKKGLLSPYPKAHAKLLSVLRATEIWDTGIRFWDWLEAQDEQYTAPGVYAVAIEMLAMRGTPLSDLENLFQRALSRFPGNFFAYHLDPQAILPDRERAIDITGIPISLLSAIIFARQMNGDSKNAYLAFDTVLRLHPAGTSVAPFLSFLEERPIAESYTVFALACRAGVQLPVQNFRSMLSAFRTSSDLSSTTKHMLMLRPMLSLTYMFAGTGATVVTNSLTEIIIAITQLLRIRGVESLEVEQKKRIAENVLKVARKTFEVFARYGVKPGVAAFNSIITNIAGIGQLKETVGIAFTDMDALSVEPTIVTWRSAVTAAGQLQDGDLLRKAWSHLLLIRAGQQQSVDATDFHVLTKACVQADDTAFVREALEQNGRHLQEHEKDNILERLEAASADNTPPQYQFASVDDVLTQIDTLMADLAVIEERTRDQPRVQNFGAQALPMTVLPPPESLRLPEHEMRKLYDEFTTEQQISVPNSHATEASAKHAVDVLQPNSNAASDPTFDIEQQTSSRTNVSLTGVSFAELRYESWKLINYMLASADRYDKAYREAVDEAIVKGVLPPKRNSGLDLGIDNQIHGYGLSDTALPWQSAVVDGSQTSSEQVQKVRKEILRLRGRLPDSG